MKSPGPKFRQDKCKTCGGPLFVLKWASKKARGCYGCMMARRAK